WQAGQRVLPRLSAKRSFQLARERFLSFGVSGGALQTRHLICASQVSSERLALGLFYSLRKSKKRARKIDRNSLTSTTLALQQEEVFLGSRSLPGWSLALSLLASLASGVGVVSVSAHQYAYGFNFAWHIAAIALTTPCTVYFFLPVLYRLKVTSVFQYLRMRFGNGVGITACVIYFFFSQTLGAVSIYSAAVGMSTMLGVPLVACNVLIGALGTTYTALLGRNVKPQALPVCPLCAFQGGLRGVVWADCVQGFVLFAAPFVIIAKIAYDSARLDVPLRPLRDISSEHYLRLEFDMTSDETMWANAVASVPFHLVREGMDQMVVQRFLAARSFRTARRVVWAGTAMVCFFCVAITLTGLALTYWYRDCDPMLTGAITRYDQMVPLYVAESLSSVAGLRGLFLAGLVGASISTISSVINSHAATFYVDIVSPNFKMREKKATMVMHFLGEDYTMKTLYSDHYIVLFRRIRDNIPDALRNPATNFKK
ncbi:hypothetical protein V5799_018099, partial [Amblyomma americanum]